MAKQQSPGGASKTAAGHRVDWAAQLAQHERWLRTILFARLRESDAVDEVMQEIALAAVRQSAPLADASKVAPWLYRLAIRQTLQYRRRHGRRRKLHDRFADRFQPTEQDHRTSDPLSWLLSNERRAMVRRALGQLHPRDAEVLLLKYTEDWSYHEIAEHLGISHSAVESRLHRARQRMRLELAALDVIETTV